jgi:2-amino-4-hydroxy-6-hydroxymethyldihydropteridine diphosphokinase
MIEVILSLGSNLGDRKHNINAALAKLDFLSDVKISSFLETPALLPENSDPSWDIPFLNIALKGFTNLEPAILFTKIKEIEKSLGRPDKTQKWAPRIIDIDIIFYGDLVLSTPEITIPHPEMHKRNFVILPICEIEPNFKHPILKKNMITLKSLLNAE